MMSKVSKDWSVVKLQRLLDPTDLVESPPWERGMFKYRSPGDVEITNDEVQVQNSLGRYSHPKYKDAHWHIKNVVENVIGEKIYPTYYYERFYFKGAELKRHFDRPSCEISVSYNVSSNLDYDWPLYFQGKNSDEPPVAITCLPGDGVIYRGEDLWHWREPMKGNHKSYFHQVFFHFVRANGPYVHYAGDTEQRTA